MKKAIKLAKYAGYTLFLVALAYFAVIEQVTGARNILYFVVGTLFVISLLTQTPKVLRDVAGQLEEPWVPSVPPIVDYCIDASYGGFFIWHGWWFTGIGFGIASLLFVAARTAITELAKQNIINKLSATY